MKKPIIQEKQDPLVKQVSNDFLSRKYRDQMGQKAIVQRSVVSGEHIEQLNEVLRDIGRDLARVEEMSDTIPYLGSCAVHIYVAPATGVMYFRVQDALGSTPMLVANSAIQELSNSIGESYTGKRKKKRSGL